MFTCVLGRYVDDDEDDLGLNVLGCRVDTLGTNCNGLPQSYWYPNLSEGADSVGHGQLRGHKECPFRA